MSKLFEAPSFRSIRFSCPHCLARAHQYWSTTHAVHLEKDQVPEDWDAENIELAILEQSILPEEERFSDVELLPEYLSATQGRIFLSKKRSDPYSYRLYNVDISRCDSCHEISIWLSGKMVHPISGPTGAANSDMPDSVKRLFNEAGAVYPTSPRAAAALLRLALQILLGELGETGDNIAVDINSLFDKGLPPNLTKVMHSLRIIGNESVHPGQISVDDDPEIAKAMFKLLNEIVEQLITRPREQEELWEMLPEGKRKTVEEILAKKKD